MHSIVSGGSASTIADVLFAPVGARVVVTLERELSRDELAAEALTSIAACAVNPEALEDEVHQLAETLDWRVRVDAVGGARHVRVGRA